ncbi:MAG TPA: hypothetical protein VFA33_04900 [Bryobacteraceae bacterium]|nr:hypothetical protein [Bryobacteraceae bacterium]
MRNIDEQPNNAPILVLGRPLRVRASAPLRFRRLAFAIRRHPREWAAQNVFLIQPGGRSNLLRASEFHIRREL